MIFDKNAEIRYIYKETPDEENDSGWRIFTGNEDDEYANNQNNIQLIEIGYFKNKR